MVEASRQSFMVGCRRENRAADGNKVRTKPQRSVVRTMSFPFKSFLSLSFGLVFFRIFRSSFNHSTFFPIL